MNEHIDRHEHACLQLSGGKDSLACLALLTPWLEKITVVWCNTGDAFPETRAQMASIRESVPHFLEVRTDAPAHIAQHGWPADVVPVTRTHAGSMIDGHELPLIQPYTTCCDANIWRPMHDAALDIGATLIIRGQRNEERRKSPIRSGLVHMGIEYWFPIEDWSERRVFAFLDEQGVALPKNYARTDNGLDCMHCTGWLKDSTSTIHWMKTAHPTEHREVARRLRVIRTAAVHEVRTLDAAIHGG